MNRYSSFLCLTGAVALVAVVATSTDAEGAGVPATPTPTLQSSTYNSVTLAWPAIAGAQRYNVQLCKSPVCMGGVPQFFAVNPATSTSGDRVVYTLKDLSAATKYYIYVQAAVTTPEASASIWSIAVEVTTPAAPPVTLRAALENNDKSTCFYYTLPSGTSSSALLTYADATAAKSTSSYGLASGATQQCFALKYNPGDACPSSYYAVKAITGSGGSTKVWESERVKPECPCAAVPAAPTNVAVTPTNGVDCRAGIDLSWTPPVATEGCTQSAVEVGGFQGMYPTVLATVDVGTKSTVHLPISNVAATSIFVGQTYKYTIAVKNELGAGAASTPVSIYCK